MKKRFLAVFLALALCMGLAVPAFAADEMVENGVDGSQYKLAVHLPDGYVMTKEAGPYRTRGLKGTGFYGEVGPLTVPTSVPLVPTGVDITLSGLNPQNGAPLDRVYFMAWSDPDGDGVYDARLFMSLSENVIGVFPLADSYSLMTNTNYWLGPPVGALDYALNFAVSQDASGSMSVTVSADRLCAMFGPNTLLHVSVKDEQDGDITAGFTIRLTGEGVSQSAPAFTDVPAGEYYAAPVAWAVEKGITNGTSDATFSPGQNCTQAEILTFLYRAARGGVTAAAGDMDKAVSWAREEGMIGASFDGGKPCTRAVAVSYIWQALGKETAKAGIFTDVPAEADYADAVFWAVERGVTKGTSDTTFSPGQVCTRGQIVTFLHRAYAG